MTQNVADRITPVILCGGSGTRLWPLSRQSYPKQFTPLIGSQSLFQYCAQRLSGPQFTPPVIVTASDFRFIATEQLMEAGVDPGPILIEPEGRNTAPAILAAALHVAATDPDAVLLVAPSDHLIEDVLGFHEAIAEGLRVVREEGRIVTFGIAPERPETGYGYLELATAHDGSGVAIPLRRFIEKPDLACAEEMAASERYLWNSGIFLFAARDILAAFTVHAPTLVDPVQAALATAQHDLGFLRLNPAIWAGIEPVSIDYAIMEKAEALSVVPYAGGWSDLGDWQAVMHAHEPDGQGVVCMGDAIPIDCTDSLLRAEGEGMAVVGIGLDRVMVVAMPDAVLVADLDRAQDAKLAVRALGARGLRQSVQFPRDHRPWGHFETLALSDRFQVKRIVVKPGGTLSLQSHMHRSEHWVVVSGTAKVMLNGEDRLVPENESIYIPLGASHRLENPGKVPMILIEVQTGAYLGEDDIIRHEDFYARRKHRAG